MKTLLHGADLGVNADGGLVGGHCLLSGSIIWTCTRSSLRSHRTSPWSTNLGSLPCGWARATAAPEGSAAQVTASVVQVRNATS